MIASAESGQVPISMLPIWDIEPAPENEQLYRPVREDDPEVLQLAESIGQFGLQHPIGVSEDGYIFDGHRRYVASRLAGLTELPCRIERIRRDTDPEGFLQLLRECNRQRVKSYDEVLRRLREAGIEGIED